MSIVADRYIVADTLSEAWLNAVQLLHAHPGRKLVHLLVRILQPPTEIPELRNAAQAFIDDWNARHPSAEMLHIDTTRNTIFPASWASRLPEPEELAAYYRARYPGLRRYHNNERGTYFGRMVAYPRGDGHPEGDQLTETVRKLRQELARRGPKSSRYEINIYAEQLDRNPMSFPCLAHLSLHLHQRQLHLQAVYRNEVLVGRAYGNYLGLAQLQQYLARACDLELGELLVTINHAELDGRAGAVTSMLARSCRDRPPGSSFY